ncbi:hypothetical protein, partial [Staphylococcus aureus]|uniref:hypothetical protein n=1 Tax=Staphylococcus aureus TaxID=1280 RepID=UPI002108AAB4
NYTKRKKKMALGHKKKEPGKWGADKRVVNKKTIFLNFFPMLLSLNFFYYLTHPPSPKTFPFFFFLNFFPQKTPIFINRTFLFIFYSFFLFCCLFFWDLML